MRIADGIRAASAALVLVVTVAACGGAGSTPATSPATGGVAAPSIAWPGTSATTASSGAATSPTATPCPTPAPLTPVGVCTAPSSGADASNAAGAGASTGPAGASPSASGGPAGSPGASSAPAPTTPTTPTASPGAVTAPTSAVGFKVRHTIVPMRFPLPKTAVYRYGDGWGAPRVGAARPYEQIRGVAPSGTYLRAHDGIDVLVKLGTPVYAPFSGNVIDPAKRWKPWDPGRYGKVVAIESDEPTSPGYVVILAHFSRQAVKVGDHVVRGQLVGKTGDTGNAVGTAPHLHLELRAPFLIRYGYGGVIRRLDVFDAEPSVRAADPKAS